MSKENNTTMQSRKSRTALMLGSGFVVGFGVALALGRWYFFRPEETKTAVPVQWVNTLAKEPEQVTPAPPIKAKQQPVRDTADLVTDEPDPSKSDTTHHEIDNAENWAEAEFAMDNTEESVVVSRNTLLDSRKVKVRLLPAINAETPVTEAPIMQFELQLWSTPIKNRMEYLRSGNVIKVKGMDIAQVEIIYQDGHYALLYAHKKYAIPANTAFEKIVEESVK
jgi:hypothetical protein